MNNVNDVIQKEEGGCKVMHVNMLKPYYQKNLWTLYALREDPGDNKEFMCWEGRWELPFNQRRYI